MIPVLFYLYLYHEISNYIWLMTLPQSAAFTSPLVHICVTLVTLCFFTKTARGRGGCLLKPQLPISYFAFVPRITLNKIKPRCYYLFRRQTKEPNAGPITAR